MNAPASFPMSPLQRASKDDAALRLREAVNAIGNNPDPRWTDAQMLVIGLATQDIKKWLIDRGQQHG